MNCFTWYKENNDWIVPEEQYDDELKNWRGPIHNGQFCSKNLKGKLNTEEKCYKYAGSVKLNYIPREGSQQYPSSPTRINAVSI